jgi:hypothetical protein
MGHHQIACGNVSGYDPIVAGHPFKRSISPAMQSGG